MSARVLCQRAGMRSFTTSIALRAPSLFKMPSMSPTMEQGGISSWKVKEGQSFAAGDVLCSIETDKAEIDVEAQDDGIMGKILKADGASGVKVGEPIAILAEEGDDISNLEMPKEAETKASSSAPAPSSTQETKESSSSAASSTPKSTSNDSHSHHSALSGQFPSVQRLLSSSQSSSIDLKSLKPSGRNGRYTKGDILSALQKIKSPFGSFTPEKRQSTSMTPAFADQSQFAAKSSAKRPVVKQEIKDAIEFRGLILQGFSLMETSRRHLQVPTATSSGSAKAFSDADYEAIFDQYLPAHSALAELQAAKEAQPAKQLLPSNLARDPYLDIFA